MNPYDLDAKLRVKMNPAVKFSRICKNSDSSRKDGNCDALQLEGRSTSHQSFWLFLAKFVLHMRTNCYFRVSDQNSDIAILATKTS